MMSCLMRSYVVASTEFVMLSRQSTSEATQLAANLKSVCFAFPNANPDEFVKTELASLLSSLGTRIVLMGNAAEDKAAQSPFDVSDRPFANDDVLRILNKES